MIHLLRDGALFTAYCLFGAWLARRLVPWATRRWPSTLEGDDADEKALYAAVAMLWLLIIPIGALFFVIGWIFEAVGSIVRPPK